MRAQLSTLKIIRALKKLNGFNASLPCVLCTTILLFILRSDYDLPACIFRADKKFSPRHENRIEFYRFSLDIVFGIAVRIKLLEVPKIPNTPRLQCAGVGAEFGLTDAFSGCQSLEEASRVYLEYIYLILIIIICFFDSTTLPALCSFSE